jgi:mediator of RNA polymerase II transcription subunit 13
LPGKSASCSRDGLVPVKFESFRKALRASFILVLRTSTHCVPAVFVSTLPATKASYVFYIATPAAIISLSSPVLRQVFSAVKRVQKAHSEVQILFHFVPSHLVYAVHCPRAEMSNLMLFSCSVYDRLLRPTSRAMSRRLFSHSERVRTLCQEPAFALAPPAHARVQLVRQYQPLALDVTERHALLHVGYRVCGRWLLAACTDARGEAHDIGVWTLQADAAEAHVATTVWAFAVAFARKASIEWRVVLAKLGLMNAAEIDGKFSLALELVAAC